ncbi:MAG: hypothetical protein ACTS2F_00095 [Thainema sp.]
MIPLLSKSASSNWPDLCQIVLRYRSDLLVGLGLMLLSGIGTYWAAYFIGSEVLELDAYGDTWFDSDVAAYYLTLANPHEDVLHSRAYKHPLISFAFCLPVYFLHFFQIDVLIAVRLMMSTVAGLWLSSLFAFLRLMGCRTVDAILLSFLGGISAAGLFWFPILESYPMGSLGYIWALAWVALTEFCCLPWSFGVFISAINLSITITNWLVAWIATGLVYPWQRALRINGVALLIVMILVGMQRVLFDSSLPWIHRNELKYVASSEVGNWWNIIQSFLCHTVVMPAVQVIAHPSKGFPIMSVQFSTPGTGSIVGAIAVGLWLGLLALGLWQLFTMKTHLRLRLMLGLSLLGQLGLHLIYTGRETFLYSLHFLPFFIGILALGALNTKRSIFIALLVTLLICTGFNNITQFEQARAFYHSYPSEQSLL